MIATSYFYSNYESSDWRADIFDNGTLKTVEYDEKTVKESFGFGVYTSYDPVIGMNLTQFLEKNESLEGYLQVTNAMNNKNEYLLFALVDYRQVPFYINGEKNLTHIVDLNSMESMFYSFEIDKLSTGNHDLLLGAFLNPHEDSLDRDYRMDTDFALMGSKRLSVSVGNNSKPFYAFEKPDTICTSPYPLEGLLVNKEPCSPKAWLTENVTKNEILDYFINIGNTKKRDKRTFAIVQFLDYEQIPLDQNNSEYVYLGTLEDGDKGSISASLAVPNNTGVHELIVVWISDPYENLEILPGIRNTDLEGRVEPSIRIGLNVT